MHHLATILQATDDLKILGLLYRNDKDYIKFAEDHQFRPSRLFAVVGDRESNNSVFNDPDKDAVSQQLIKGAQEAEYNLASRFFIVTRILGAKPNVENMLRVHSLFGAHCQKMSGSFANECDEQGRVLSVGSRTAERGQTGLTLTWQKSGYDTGATYALRRLARQEITFGNLKKGYPN